MNEPDQTFNLVYGLAEGAFTASQLRRAANGVGLTSIKSDQSPEYTIAHSGGCMILDELTAKKVVLLINPCVWSGKSLFRSLGQKLRYDYRIARNQRKLWNWFWHGCSGWVYLCKIRHTRRLYRGLHANIAVNPMVKTIIVRNQEDNYCNALEALGKFGDNYVFISLPGGHDDLWRNSEPYFEIARAV